jgi:hypothetical protein
VILETSRFGKANRNSQLFFTIYGDSKRRLQNEEGSIVPINDRLFLRAGIMRRLKRRIRNSPRLFCPKRTPPMLETTTKSCSC